MDSQDLLAIGDTQFAEAVGEEVPSSPSYKKTFSPWTGQCICHSVVLPQGQDRRLNEGDVGS